MRWPSLKKLMQSLERTLGAVAFAEEGDPEAARSFLSEPTDPPARERRSLPRSAWASLAPRPSQP